MMTSSQKKAWWLVSLSLAAVAGWLVFDYFVFKSPVGGVCKDGSDCRGFSPHCLPSQAVAPGSFGVTLLPKHRGPGVCTRFCDGDSDCPDQMECGTVADYHVEGSLSFGAPATSKMCVPRKPKDAEQ